MRELKDQEQVSVSGGSAVGQIFGTMFHKDAHTGPGGLYYAGTGQQDQGSLYGLYQLASAEAAAQGVSLDAAMNPGPAEDSSGILPSHMLPDGVISQNDLVCFEALTDGKEYCEEIDPIEKEPIVCNAGPGQNCI